MSTSQVAPEAAQESGAHIDPAAQLGFVPVQTRSERERSFDPEDFGMPTGREVNWKHTPLDRLVTVLTDEATESAEHSEIEYGVDRVEQYLVESTGHQAKVRGEFFMPEDLPSALAWKHCANALHIRIPANEEVGEPLLVNLTGRGGHAQAHIVLEAMPNSQATILLYHSGKTQYAQNVEIIVRDGARLTVVSAQRWDEDAVHVASHQARVDRDAFLKHFVVSLGGGVVRVNPTVELSGAGSEAELYGLSYADPGQHLESQVYLHHKGPQTRGDVLYKGVLQGEGARSVWIGDVLIGRDAVGTDSYEANRNLVLTEGARAESIPNLEIETGDIQGAGHASATGRFDDEQLFYLHSRGIDDAEARRLVVLGFLSDIIQRLGIPHLESELLEVIDNEIAEGMK
jgi:Fe-S cluster assembly protein SufD